MRIARAHSWWQTNRKVALGAGIVSSAGQGGADLLSERMLAAGTRDLAVGESTLSAAHDVLGSRLECVLLKLDRHGGG